MNEEMNEKPYQYLQCSKPVAKCALHQTVEVICSCAGLIICYQKCVANVACERCTYLGSSYKTGNIGVVTEGTIQRENYDSIRS